MRRKANVTSRLGGSLVRVIRHHHHSALGPPDVVWRRSRGTRAEDSFSSRSVRATDHCTRAKVAQIKRSRAWIPLHGSRFLVCDDTHISLHRAGGIECSELGARSFLTWRGRVPESRTSAQPGFRSSARESPSAPSEFGRSFGDFARRDSCAILSTKAREHALEVARNAGGMTRQGTIQAHPTQGPRP